MKKRNVVKQSHQLINAKYKLNTSELKFILNALTQIDADDKEFTEYEIKVSELEQALQVKQNETRLKQFAKKLLSKPLEVPTEKGWIVFNWFADIEYITGEAKFIVTISEKLKPYLLELKARFTKYNLMYILPLSSNYSIRLYQLFKEYEKLTKRTFTVEELQELLQVPKSFKRYSQFKQKVLQVAEKELIENCDIFFEYEEIKKGRKITELLFRIKPNKQNIEKKAPVLFSADPNKFEKYRYKKIITKDGEKEINFIEDLGEYLKIYFIDGEVAHIENIEKLNKVIK